MSTVEANPTLVEKLFSDETGGLVEESFNESTLLIIQNSLSQAEKLGQSQIGLSAFLLAMIEQSDEHDETPPIQEFAAKLKVFIGDDESAHRALELTREFLTEDVQRVLVTAYELAENDETQIEPQHLWAAVLAEAPHFLKRAFEKLPFQVEFETGEEETTSRVGSAVRTGEVEGDTSIRPNYRRYHVAGE